MSSDAEISLIIAYLAKGGQAARSEVFETEYRSARACHLVAVDILSLQAMDEDKEPLQLSIPFDQARIVDRLTRKFNLSKSKTFKNKPIAYLTGLSGLLNLLGNQICQGKL